jgi:hypothetical protein
MSSSLETSVLLCDAAAMPEIDLHGAQTTTVFNLSTDVDVNTYTNHL